MDDLLLPLERRQQRLYGVQCVCLFDVARLYDALVRIESLGYELCICRGIGVRAPETGKALFVLHFHLMADVCSPRGSFEEMMVSSTWRTEGASATAASAYGIAVVLSRDVLDHSLGHDRRVAVEAILLAGLVAELEKYVDRDLAAIVAAFAFAPELHGEQLRLTAGRDI